MLTEKSKNNFREAIKDLDESIPKDEEGLKDAEKCLEYMGLNYYDKDIEKKIAEILKFYTNDLKELVRQHHNERDAYKKVLKDGKL